MPHSTEAAVKPTTENRKMVFWPKRSHSQPVSGVAIADATIYDVSTQVIWSCEADRLPCMCGSATLAMVPSIACMMVASMIEMVIMPRLMPCGRPASNCSMALLMLPMRQCKAGRGRSGKWAYSKCKDPND
jgi:hypothetical protein